MSDKKEEEKQDKEEKRCFIIMPIGKTDTIEQEKSFGLLNSVIRPVVENLGFKCIPPHEITDTGAISKRIINEIVDDDLVIANLTGLNPNVMYEVGIRHSVAKPIVTLSEEGTPLPFDISDQRNIFYKDSLFGFGKVTKQLDEFLTNVKNKTEDRDNPVCNATQRVIFNPGDNNVPIEDFLKQMANDISSLKADISNLKGSYQSVFSEPVKSTFGTPDLNLDLGNFKMPKVNIDTKGNLIFNDNLEK